MSSVQILNLVSSARELASTYVSGRVSGIFVITMLANTHRYSPLTIAMASTGADLSDDFEGWDGNIDAPAFQAAIDKVDADVENQWPKLREQGVLALLAEAMVEFDPSEESLVSAEIRILADLPT